MQYLVSVDHNSMAAHLTRSNCEGYNAVDGTDDNMLWNDSEGDGDVRSEHEEDEGTDCEDGETATDW